jgi:hypothetical protein
MRGKVWQELAAKKKINDENTSNRQLNYEHIRIENLNSRKIFHEKRCFSTAC